MHALFVVAPSLLLHAATLSTATVPATGKSEALLTLDAPAAVHLSAKSASGTSCTIVDRVRGPFAGAGTAGRANCELDLLLDAGQYKLRLESAARGKGVVQLSAKPFTELNTSPVKLVPRALVEGSLSLGQQASYWLSLTERTNPHLRVSGHNAGDVRLWRNGEWLEPLTLTHSEYSLDKGKAVHEWWLDQVLEAGEYVVTAYGRDAAGATNDWRDDALSMQWGFAPSPPENAVAFTMPRSGVYAVELPSQGLAAFLSFDTKVDGSLTVFAGSRDGSMVGGTSCSTRALGLSPECSVSRGGAPFAAVVRAPPGTRGRLEWAIYPTDRPGTFNSILSSGGYFGPPTKTLSFYSGATKALLSLRDVPADTDSAPLGCVLEEFSRDTQGDHFVRQVATSVPKVAPGQMLEQQFNYDGYGAVIWFEVGASARYRITAAGERKSTCEVYQSNGAGELKRITQSAPEAKSCSELLSLGTGLYQLRLSAGLSGVEQLTIREDSTKPQKAIAPKVSCTFPEANLSAGFYKLNINRGTAGQVRGLEASELPLTLTRAVHVTLDAKGSLSVPIAGGEAAQVLSSGAVAFGCSFAGVQVTASEGHCGVPPHTTTDTLTLTNPGDAPLTLTLGRFRATAPLPVAQAFSPSSKPLPRIAPDVPAPFDFDRDQTRVVTFDVETPGLYSVTTQGLLSTACRLRTPVVNEVAANTSGGRGRNCLISTYLQKGRYMLTATTVGQSRGRGAMFLSRKPAKEQASVVGEAETFFRSEANELVQQRVTVRAAGPYTLTTAAQGASLSCRLDDPEGWPVEAVPTSCSGQRAMTAGTYLWTQLPLTVESMRRTKLERVRDPVVLKGNKPHTLEPFTWYSAELGPDGKDEFLFTLEGEVQLDVVLTNAMQGRVYLLEADKPPKAVEVIAPMAGASEAEQPPPEESAPPQEYEREYEGGDGEEPSEGAEPQVAATQPVAASAAPPPPSGAKLTLPTGKYKLVTEHSRGDVGISYQLHFGSATLLPGMSRAMPVPSSIPVFVPRDGTLRLRTEGEADVRCRLFDAKGQLVFEGSENGADWNCAIAEPVSKGQYSLVIESETQQRGETKLALALAPSDDKGVVQDKTKVSLGASVVTYEIPVAEKDAVQEVSARAQTKQPFSCAVTDATGRVLVRKSRVTDCSVLLRPKLEHFKLRLWTTDGAAGVELAYRARPITTDPSIAAAGASTLSVKAPGRYATAPQVFCIAANSTGLLSSCGPEVSLETGETVFATFGAAALSLPMTDVRVAASDVAVPLSLSASPFIQVVTAKSPSLFLTSATVAYGERVAPSCRFDGAGTVQEGRDARCDAVSKVATEAVARVWAPTEQPVTAQVVRRALALPERAEPLALGRRHLSFSTTGLYSLPATRTRLELTLPRDSWAISLDDQGNARDFCAPTSDLRRCVLTATGGRLLLTAPSGQADVTTITLESPPQSIAFTGLYEDAPRTPGTVKLNVPANAQERTAHIDGALRCTVSLSTGARVPGCHATIPPNTSAELLIEHSTQALRAVVHVPGRERWARLGVELPVVPGPALSSAVAVPLQSGRVDRSLVLDKNAVVRVSAESGVCAVFRGSDLLSVDGMDTGCELVRVLAPGTYRLVVRPFSNRPALGTMRWTAEPVAALTEGIGPEEWVAPGEVRLYRFDTKDKGKVGLGLQAKSELLDCAVFNDAYKPLGDGCQQYLTLDKGSFLLTVRNPLKSGAVPVAFKPVLLGLSGDQSDVPEAFLKDFFSRIGVQP